jgi:hypothetical protein
MIATFSSGVYALGCLFISYFRSLFHTITKPGDFRFRLKHHKSPCHRLPTSHLLARPVLT